MGELSVRELPLFPLPEVVLFPQEVLPLHIFESRYRIMLQSVLESDSMFGVIKWDPTTKNMAKVGCCAQIIKHQTAEDGRSNIITLGQQRFQVLEIIRSTPFCSAMVSWINDDNVDDLQKLDSLKDSVKEALSDVINLTSKLTNTKKNLPDKLPDNPMDLSFWIGAPIQKDKSIGLSGNLSGRFFLVLVNLLVRLITSLSASFTESFRESNF